MRGHFLLFSLTVFLSATVAVNGWLATRRPLIFNNQSAFFDAEESSHVNIKWMEQKLDHFNEDDTRLWNMRYMVNRKFFKTNGPIFILVGGEGAIQPEELQSGQIYDIAKQHNAIMLSTEHRYYGKSHPTPDASTANLKWLTIDQALADLAYFIRHIKHHMHGLKNSKVVLFGGSYPANLAVWFRLKYPHLVVGALASSAAPMAAVDDWQFFQDVSKSLLKIGGKSCHQTFKKAITAIMKKFKTKEGIREVADLFNLCNTMSNNNPNDMEAFIASIAVAFGKVVQYHRPGDIEEVCDSLNTQKGHPLEKLAGFFDEYWGTILCLHMDYNYYVDLMNKTTWEEVAEQDDARQWWYQSCTSFGLHTSFSKNKHFPEDALPLQFYLNVCKDVFKEVISDDEERVLETSVNRLNQIYGGLHPNVSNVIFTYGAVDPWHTMGIQEDLNESAPAIRIPGYGHCHDLSSLTDFDSEEMKAAKLRVQKIIGTWLI